MNANEKTLNTFATRVRQMILQYEELKNENSDLYALVAQHEEEIKDLQSQLAKMLEVTDGDMEVAKKRVTKLIRDVNKCITLLSEK